MKKLISVVLVLCMLLVSAAIAEELNYDFNVGFSSLGNYNAFWVTANESIVNAAADKGIELHWTIDDRDAAKMKTAIDTFVLQEVDIIVDGTVLAETGTAIAAELAREGIPMLSIDCYYEGAYFFGINNADVGTTIGKFAKDWIDTNWEGQLDQIQVLFNEANGEENKLRCSNAANLLMDENYIDEANVIYTNINSSGATVTDVSYVRSLVVDYLTAHPDDHHILIIAQTDDQGTAANSAVIQSGREDDVIITSINADAAVVKMLQEKSGCIIGSFNANPKGYGPQIMDACAKILAAEKNGEEIDKVFTNSGIVVGRDNVWELYPDPIE